jgi:hypothetical protein
LSAPSAPVVPQLAPQPPPHFGSPLTPHAPYQIRDEELRLIRATGVVKTVNLCLVFAVPPVIALVIFATFAHAVGPLTPAMAFVVLSLFNTLRFPLVVLPKALRGVSGEELEGRLPRG